jgi:multidrug efflux system membrane fusion protein
VQQYDGAKESDQSQVDSAKLNLVYCEVMAPITGRIGLRLVDIGNIVHAADTNGLAVITQLQPISVIFTVPEDQISDVFRRPDHGEGLPLDAYNRDMTQKIATGKLLAIDNQVDPTTGTVRIKGEFANLDYSLFPNQFVNARLLIDTLKGVVLVPSAAVQLGPQSSNFVYVVKADKTVELRTITEGHHEGGLSAINEGIKPGEVVVTDGVDKLTSGSKVTVRMASASGNQSTTQSTTQPAAHAGGHRHGNAGTTTKPAGVDAGEAK